MKSQTADVVEMQISS